MLSRDWDEKWNGWNYIDTASMIDECGGLLSLLVVDT